MSTIEDINIAVGLKEALLSAGITLEQIINCRAEEIALTLGIDQYVAILIKRVEVKTRTESSMEVYLHFIFYYLIYFIIRFQEFEYVNVHRMNQ